MQRPSSSRIARGGLAHARAQAADSHAVHRWYTGTAAVARPTLDRHRLTRGRQSPRGSPHISPYLQAVSQRIRTDLLSRAREFHLELDDVSITHLSFGKEYTAAVEAKQVAQQEAERAKFVVDKAKQEKKSTVIKAQGEAKSAKLIGDAVRDNPGYIQLRRLEARRVVGAC